MRMSTSLFASPTVEVLVSASATTFNDDENADAKADDNLLRNSQYKILGGGKRADLSGFLWLSPDLFLFLLCSSSSRRPCRKTRQVGGNCLSDESLLSEVSSFFSCRICPLSCGCSLPRTQMAFGASSLTSSRPAATVLPSDSGTEACPAGSCVVDGVGCGDDDDEYVLEDTNCSGMILLFLSFIRSFDSYPTCLDVNKSRK
mmetsp:Transcript_15018/g.36945  ORF Transcript_15018/g.36945 Transcript_15018/m.36945 type:complete len:202 (+) Transcript_15018:2711-3316(+)